MVRSKKEEIRFKLISERKEKLDFIAEIMGYNTATFLMFCYDYYLENSHNTDLKKALTLFQVKKNKEDIMK